MDMMNDECLEAGNLRKWMSSKREVLIPVIGACFGRLVNRGSVGSRVIARSPIVQPMADWNDVKGESALHRTSRRTCLGTSSGKEVRCTPQFHGTQVERKKRKEGFLKDPKLKKVENILDGT